MWVAVHLYITFKANATSENNKFLVEENVVLMNVTAHEDVYKRLDELESIYGSGAIYPGYERVNSLGVRKIVSVSNFDDGDATLQPGDRTEVTYELYEFFDEQGVARFIKGESIHANMEGIIRRKLSQEIITKTLK